MKYFLYRLWVWWQLRTTYRGRPILASMFLFKTKLPFKQILEKKGFIAVTKEHTRWVGTFFVDEGNIEETLKNESE